MANFEEVTDARNAMGDMSSTGRKRPITWRLGILLAVLGAVAIIAITQPIWRPIIESVQPEDRVPHTMRGGRLERREGHVVLHLSGTPEDMGRQHGTMMKENIRLMLNEYIAPSLQRDHGKKLRAAIDKMRPVLPEALVRELNACAKAANVDPTELLLAQCIGDAEYAVIGWAPPAGEGCSAYVAFGPATAGGHMECGRNLDYSLSRPVARRCSLVTYYSPAEGEGYRFVAVGISGMITGWTLINEHGLIVANHLGGGIESQIEGIPTLLLARQIAQHTQTVDEGIELIRNARRMRGQIIWLAQEADRTTKRPARAVAVEYDAGKVAVREAQNGILIVTNTNRVFRENVPENEVSCSRYQRLRECLESRRGLLDGSDPLTLDRNVATSITQHVVHVIPSQGVFKVWHRTGSRIPLKAVSYPMPGSL